MLSKLRFALALASITAGMTAGNVCAEDANVSEKDMLAQAVALYEKLSGSEVAVPDGLVKYCGTEALGKAVMLGFKNADEAASSSDAIAIRKQDALTILYKTMISYDYSFALSSDEIDLIMNECYDNALVDEKNRAGYAFMLKHRIIDNGYMTEPNKLITWSSCATLVDVLYDLFVQDVSFCVNDAEIKIGTNIETVTEVFGEPSRIDKSDYEFDWYVYNEDPANFMMVGVKEDRICAFFSNSGNFSFGDLKSGDDYLLAFKYLENPDFRILKATDGTIDAIMYNPYTKSDVALSNDTYIRSCELVDIVNAYRAKNEISALNISDELYKTAEEMAPQPKYHELARDERFEHIMDDAQHEEGYDIFLIYQKLLTNGSECFSEDINSIGVSTYADEDFNIFTSLICAKDSAVLTTEPADIDIVSPGSYVFETTAYAETEGVPAEEEPIEGIPAEEVLPPALVQISSPLNDSVIAEGDDLVLELAENNAPVYYVQIYSIEDDEYIASTYMNVVENKLVFTSDMFTSGKDYTVSVCAVNSAGMSEATEITVRYGEVPADALTLITPEAELVTDDDFIDLEWNTALYSDFVIDAYDEDGKLVLSHTVSDTNSVTVNNIDPGTYYFYITALRKGSTDVFKAQAMLTAQINLPEPVITEYILDEGEVFYPVYEDREMGLLRFYEEEIISVPVTMQNGATVTAKRKKITEKQVKSVNYYRTLAKEQIRVESFIGSPNLTIDEVKTEFTYTGSQMSIYNEALGGEIVREAEKYLGVPYLWGGTTPRGFDCSGLVQYVYRNLGINLTRVSQTQYLEGTPLTRDELLPGDLVFFEENGDVHHVGIYAGDGYMIHAPYTGAVVSYQSIDADHYKSQFCGGRRVY